MSAPRIITFDAADHLLDWRMIMDAIKAGHQRPPAQIKDVFLQNTPNTMLNRSAWIDGLGLMVKVATVFPAATPTINGGVLLFDGQKGRLRAVIDFALVTKWKTIGDSLLGAQQLARANSQRLLCVGAGTVIANAIDGYRSIFDDLDVTIWNRSPERAVQLAKQMGATAITDLAGAVQDADIICCATMSVDPIIKGEWLRAGTHLDLIGAYRPDMREVDDTALTRSRIFVDSYASTLDHIGELRDPLARGVIARDDVLGDYYDLAGGQYRRETEDEITLFKNGGGAHLDLMVSEAICLAVGG